VEVHSGDVEQVLSHVNIDEHIQNLETAFINRRDDDDSRPFSSERAAVNDFAEIDAVFERDA
jgi:hypothetical protein